VIEPQYVFGAATFVVHPHTEIKTEHVAKGQVRQKQESGKNQQIRPQREFIP
jgi:hypothetical protein